MIRELPWLYVGNYAQYGIERDINVRILKHNVENAIVDGAI